MNKGDIDEAIRWFATYCSKPIEFGAIHEIENTGIDTTYTIKIYVPYCETGYLFYEEHNVSYNFLIEENLASSKSIFNLELTPSDDYSLWESYTKQKIHKPTNNDSY